MNTSVWRIFIIFYTCEGCKQWIYASMSFLLALKLSTVSFMNLNLIGRQNLIEDGFGFCHTIFCPSLVINCNGNLKAQKKEIGRPPYIFSIFTVHCEFKWYLQPNLIFLPEPFFNSSTKSPALIEFAFKLRYFIANLANRRLRTICSLNNLIFQIFELVTYFDEAWFTHVVNKALSCQP